MTTAEMNSQKASVSFPSLFESVTSENPKAIPLRPQAMIDYDKLSPVARVDVNERFFKQEFIQKYLEEKWKAEEHNRTCFLWLIEFQDEFLDKNNADQVRAIKTKLEQFAKVIAAQVKPFPALYLDPKKYGVEIGKSQEVGGWQE